MAKVRGFTLENISNIKIVFSTFDNRVSSARELFRRVSSSKLQQTNPKCQIISKITEDLADPSIEVTFSDDTKLRFNCAELPALKMVEQINTKSRSLKE